jgi:PhzF family phenazine biosynthesis protein
MRAVHFKQVDVFTARPFLGNPVAVILDADGLSEAQMARIASWTNLSETTFVSPSERASYRLRIFTPRAELPFAGHPTIGSAHAVREAGIVRSDATTLVQECGAGLIPLSVAADGVISARVPRPRVAAFPFAPSLGQLLGAPADEARVVDVGPRWIVVAVASAVRLRALAPDLRAMAALNRETETTGVTVYAAADGGVEVRSFAPLHGIDEDPVCGSGNASVAAHLRATGGLARYPGARYLARQGAAVGRAGEIQVAVDGDDVTIGGAAVTVIEGTIRLD